MTRPTDLAVLSRVAEHRQGPFTGMPGVAQSGCNWWCAVDKFAANFLPMVQLVSLRLGLREAQQTTRIESGAGQVG
jgi:hypothetical protein